jgi:hypothetical protein
MKFQLVVIIILGILLIITLIAFYYIATSSGNNIKFPPSIPICPDYYYQTTSSDKNKIRCTAMSTMMDKLNSRITADTTLNTNDNKNDQRANCINPEFPPHFYTGTRANCNKYNWTKGCYSIPAWEGITYGVRNPCHTKKKIN